MTGRVASRLEELGIALPDAPPPVANYVPYRIAGSLVFVSGQVSTGGSGLIVGQLGNSLSVEEGRAAARACAINLLAQLHSATQGDLDRVASVVRLGGFVNCTSEFSDHPAVINGASDLMVDVFGEVGRHARTAVGCPSLPLGVAVEVDGTFLIS